MQSCGTTYVALTRFMPLALSTPPENIRKPYIFWSFQGGIKEISGKKWVNLEPILRKKKYLANISSAILKYISIVYRERFSGEPWRKSSLKRVCLWYSASMTKMTKNNNKKWQKNAHLNEKLKKEFSLHRTLHPRIRSVRVRSFFWSVFSHIWTKYRYL